MYCLSKKEFQKDRIKVMVLFFIIGLSIGICAGFLWGTVTVDDLIRAAVVQAPERMIAIPF